MMNAVAFADASAEPDINLSTSGKIPNDAHKSCVKLPDLEFSMSCPKKVLDIAWNTAQAPGTIVGRINSGVVARDLIASVMPVTTPGWVTWDKVVFTLTGSPNPFSNGVLGMCVLPRPDAATDCFITNTAGAPVAMKMDQNLVGLFDAPSDNMLTVQVPNLMPTGSIAMPNCDLYAVNSHLAGDFELIIYVQHKLLYGTGGSDMTLELFASFQGFRVETIIANAGDDDEKDNGDLTSRGIARLARKAATSVGRLGWPSSAWDFVDTVAESFGFGTSRAENVCAINTAQNITQMGPRQTQTLGHYALEDKPTWPAIGDGDTIDPRLDEMSFDNMLTVPYLRFYNEYAIGTAPGVITSLPLSLSVGDAGGAGGLLTNTHPVHLMKFFALGRGTIKFTITVAHSKQKVRFVAGVVFGDNHTFGTNITRQLCPNLDFSIGEDVEDCPDVKRYILEVPYCALQQYLSILGVGDGGVSSTNYRQVFGMFTLRSVTAISGPDTCGPISISVHTSFHDVELAGSNTADVVYVPAINSSSQITAHAGDSTFENLGVSDWHKRNKENNGVKCLGQPKAPTGLPYFSGLNNPLHFTKAVAWSVKGDQGPETLRKGAQVMCGAPVKSFRVLLSKLTALFNRDPASFNLYGDQQPGDFRFFHNYVYDTVAAAGSDKLIGDFVALFRSYFAYESGDLALMIRPAHRMPVQPVPPVSTRVSNHLDQSYWLTPWVADAGQDYLKPLSTINGMWNFPESGPVAFVELPRYSTTPFQANHPCCSAWGYGADVLDTSQTSTIVYKDSTNNLMEFSLYRGGTNNTNYRMRRPPMMHVECDNYLI
jgi:hypothetical protein